MLFKIFIPLILVVSSCAWVKSHPQVEAVAEKVAEDVVKEETGIDISPILPDPKKK